MDDEEKRLLRDILEEIRQLRRTIDTLNDKVNRVEAEATPLLNEVRRIINRFL